MALKDDLKNEQKNIDEAIRDDYDEMDKQAYEHALGELSKENREEVARLERHINILGTIGYIAPLLGLLGTVLGLMEAFQSVHSTESVYLSVTELASAVNLALITTASGLAVAIFCYAAYNYLHARLDSITLDIEKAASEISAFFERQAPEVTAGTAADAGVEK